LLAYGACIKENLDHLSKDRCASEFAALQTCAQTAVATLRARRR
jgi:hypothetical protein